MAQWIYGKNAVRSIAGKTGKAEEIFIADNLKNDPAVREIRSSGIKVTFVPKAELKRLSGTDKHQGFVAKAADYKTWSLNDLIEEGKRKEYPLIVLLDGLEDPHNLGAVLRSCDAVNADGVVYAKNRSVSLNPTVAKVSVGAIDTVKVAEVTNLSQAIETLKKNGYWIVGAADKDSRDYRTVDYKCPVALVIGSEGFGISRLVKEKCDFKVGLPMKGEVNSLNASVAAGIFLYAIDADRYPAKEVSVNGGKRNQ